MDLTNRIGHEEIVKPFLLERKPIKNPHRFKQAMAGGSQRRSRKLGPCMTGSNLIQILLIIHYTLPSRLQWGINDEFGRIFSHTDN